MTPPRLVPAVAPSVQFILGDQPGDRGRLVEVLARLLIEQRRRSKSQLGMVAARAREVYDQAAKERQRASGGDHKQKPVVEDLPQPGSARDAAGKAVGRPQQGVEDLPQPIHGVAADQGDAECKAQAAGTSRGTKKSLPLKKGKRTNTRVRPPTRVTAATRATGR